MRREVLPAALLLLVSVLAVQSETLREVLVKNAVPLAGLAEADLSKSITSYATLDDSTYFCIAYYLDIGRFLDKELHVWLLNKSANTWTRRALDYGSLIPGDPHFSTGSATGIGRSANYFHIRTHRNPSAGNILVLSRNLEFREALSGWPLAVFQNETLVFHNSQVHFAPVHAAEISIYDPNARREKKIYPLRPFQPLRRKHIERIRASRSSRTDRPPDAEWFNNDLWGKVVVNGSTDSLAFIIAYDNKELLTEEEVLKIEAFRDYRRNLTEKPSGPLHLYLYSDLGRMKRIGKLDEVVELFKDDPEIYPMVRQLAVAERRSDMSAEEFFRSLNPAWDNLRIWRKLGDLTAAPPEYTHVAYIYRDVTASKEPRYIEMLWDELKQAFGADALSECLTPEGLNRIFEQPATALADR